MKSNVAAQRTLLSHILTQSPRPGGRGCRQARLSAEVGAGPVPVQRGAFRSLDLMLF